MPAALSRRDFDARLRPLYANLLHTAHKRVGPDCAPDVVQNTLLAAWRKTADFAPCQGQDAFAAWLHAHLSIEIVRFIRQEARHAATPLPAVTVFELCDGPDAPHWEAEGWEAQRQELYRRLHNFALTPRQRDCCLRWLGGETLRQIGAAQEPPVSAVAVHKIIQRVGRLMAGVDDADTPDFETLELIKNYPEAHSYTIQQQEWARARRQANQSAQQRTHDRNAMQRGGRA